MRNRIIILSALIALSLINPFDASARRHKGTGIVAHRGFWNCEAAGYARNSVAALKCAQEAGVWGSEFDVNMTADEVLLVFHDSSVDGKSIEKHKYEDFKYYRLENGEPIPTIDQYLEQGKKHPETMLVYEIKGHSCNEVEDRVVEVTIEKLKEHGLLDPSKVMFISFSINICEEIAKKLPGFTVQFLGSSLSPDELAPKGINGVDYNHAVYGKHTDWYEQARKHGMSINAWTVNNEEDMRNMLEMKIDMLTTDYPLLSRDVMKDMKIKEL